MAIDFQLSEAQQALQAGARAFGAEVLRKVAPTIAAIARPEDRFYATRPFYNAMAEAGFIKALLPASVGGTALITLWHYFSERYKAKKAAAEGEDVVTDAAEAEELVLDTEVFDRAPDLDGDGKH